MRHDMVTARHFDAMGTSCSLFGVGIDSGKLREGESWVRRFAARLTRFSPDSELARLNRARGRWVDVSAEMEELLRESLRAFEMSKGLVNVAVLPSMLTIGYTRPMSQGPTETNLSDASPLPKLPDVLTVRTGVARLAPGCGIDLGGLAKGWMADRLRARLGPNAIANLGGDLSAGGSGPDGDGWPVGISGAGVTILLRDQGAATSSVRRRRWNGLHHLIDPRTGLSADTGLEDVSVVARTGFDAEVIAKTALLAGPVIARAFCATHAFAWWLRTPSHAAAAGVAVRS
jgi:thiamine biosynthesis lipoprotein